MSNKRDHVEQMVAEVQERIEKAERSLDKMLERQKNSDEPWDFVEAIRGQEEYLEGLYKGLGRLHYKLR
jgi:hypothetical protein